MTNNRGKKINSFPEVMERILPALSKTWPDLFENTSTSDRDKIKVFELFGQGATSRQFLIRIPMLPEGERKFFVKQYVLEKGNRDFWETQLKQDVTVAKILSRTTATSRWFKVLRPYIIIPNDLLSITEYVEGQNLGHLFSKALRFSMLPWSSFEHLHNFVRLAGHGLAELQSLDLDMFFQVFGQPDLNDYIGKVLMSFDDTAIYLEKSGCLPELINWGRQTFENILTPSHFREKMCFQHNDFILQNFIVDIQNRLFLFDFPNAKFGFPYWDIAHFIYSLEDFSYLRTVPEKHVRSLVRSFLLSFETHQRLDPLMLDAFRLYFQFLSTMIILRVGHSQRSGFRRLLHENTLNRFERRVRQLLKSIDDGNGELASMI
ncbi:MAG: phosphotransferase [Deltaproteobacteria bacterium]|nr:phosphotransferase [Deltaproteobacteria bacterium]